MNSSFEIPVSAIKVRIPIKRRELIPRPRLIEKLYTHLDKTLLFVIAPAGYGKTSLLIDLATQVEMPVCWLALDVLDQDPQRFLRYMIAALSERFPDFGRDSLAVLGSMTSLTTDLEQVLVTLCNEIDLRIGDHFLLVLDDFHLVEKEARIYQLLGRFLQLCGETVHLVISSRNLPDLPVSPMLIARNQAGGLSFEDLSFQVEEIQKLFQQNHGIDLSEQDAGTILKETEGWVAAIHLSNGTSTSMPHFQPLHSTSTLFDFFSQEVIKRQPEDLRRFLVMTSLFDAFDIDLCRKVFKPLMLEPTLDLERLFHQVLTSTNLFSIPLDREGHWIRYHHLFQHFLRSQLQYESPALAWNIQQSLAQVYEQERKIEDALQIYEQLNDHPNLIWLLIKTGADFISAGRILTLETWLKKVPAALTYTHPALLSLMGAVLTTQGDQRQALHVLDLAERQQHDVAEKNEWFKTLIRRAEVHRQLGEFREALQDVDQIADGEDRTPEHVMEVILADTRRVRGLALFGLGHSNEALSWLEDSLLRYRQLGLTHQIPIVETELGVIHRRLGDLGTASRYYASALSALEQSGNTGWKARLLNNMGMLKYMSGQVEEAHQLLQDAVHIAKMCGYVRIQTNALISLGDLQCDLGDFDAAFSSYDFALTYASELGHSIYIFYASLGEVRLKHRQGDPTAALLGLRQVELSQVKLGSYERAFFNLERGQCLLEIGQNSEALETLRSAAALFSEGGNQMEEKLARFWQAAAQSFTDMQTAVSILQDNLPPQREWSTPTPLILHAGRIANWLRMSKQTRLLRDPDLRVFFEHALRVLDGLPTLLKSFSVNDLSVNDQKPRLDIHTFGQIQIYNHGRLIQLSDWQTREARDLFLYLLQSSPRKKEQIAADFWPDLAPARIKMRFKINIYRIRRALGQDTILFKDDSYAFNRSLPYTWDRERLLNLTQQIQQSADTSERVRQLEMALDLLRAGYLNEIQSDWAYVEHNHFVEQLQHMLLDLAELQLQQGHGLACLGLAREVLGLEPLLESAHRLVLQAYAAQHDPAGLATQYQQYRESLESELGMLPSLEIRVLYEKLMNAI